MDIYRKVFIGKISSAAAIIPFNKMCSSAITATVEQKYQVSYLTKPLDVNFIHSYRNKYQHIQDEKQFKTYIH
jgi:hypothetical protein